MRTYKITITCCLLLLVIISASIIVTSCNKTTGTITVVPSQKVQLGKLIFFDKTLSNPVGQSCSSCHSASTAFSDPTHSTVSAGSVTGLFGNRNAPVATYASFIPPFHYDNIDSTYMGGLFLDGRVNTLEEQAQKPFLNPLEMNNTNAAMLIGKLKNATYYSLFKEVYGELKDDNKTFSNIANAIASYERSPELNPFTSKFDYYLKGLATLNEQELRGLKLFNDTVRAKCGNCHLSTPDEASGKILFTDFTYNSDGVPRNPFNPFYNIPIAFNPLGTNYVDYGLGSILNDHNHDGEFRVPTLRNIALTAPYFHNGVFGTLEEVVHFYNVRDVPGSGIAKPEVATNIDTEETGNQHLTPQEEADIVAFMKTLTDGYK